MNQQQIEKALSEKSTYELEALHRATQRRAAYLSGDLIPNFTQGKEQLAELREQLQGCHKLLKAIDGELFDRIMEYLGK